MGSFQCWGVLLIWIIVGWFGYFFSLLSFFFCKLWGNCMVLYTVIWGGKSLVLWLQISFSGEATEEP